DALTAGQGVVGVQRLGVGDALVAGPADLLPVAVLGADAWVVQPRGDRMHDLGLAVVVLEHVAEAAVQDSGAALDQAGGVVAALRAAPAGLGADDLDRLVADERGEHAGGVRAAPDAGHDRVGQPAEPVEALLAR